MTQLAQDTGAGSATGSGWGTGSDGNAWTSQAGSPLSGIIRNGSGNLVIKSSTASAFETYSTQTPTDNVQLARFTPDATTSLFGILFRWQNTSNHYLMRYDGNSHLVFMRKVSNSYSNLVTVTKTVSAGTAYWIRMSNVGTAVQARLWQDGTSEPSTWDINTTDSTYTSGKFGMYGFSSGGTGVKYDSYTVTDGGVSTNHFGTRLLSQSYTAAVLRTRSVANFFTRTHLRDRTTTNYKVVALLRMRSIGQFQIAKAFRGRGQSSYQIKAGLSGRTQAKYSVRTHFHTRTLPTFETRTRLVSVSTSQFKVALRVAGRARTSFQTAAYLRSRSVAGFSSRTVYRVRTSSVFKILNTFKSLASRASVSFLVQARLGQRLSTQSVTRVRRRANLQTSFPIRTALRASSRTQFSIRIHLAARATSAFQISKAFRSRVQTTFKVFSQVLPWDALSFKTQPWLLNAITMSLLLSHAAQTKPLLNASSVTTEIDASAKVTSSPLIATFQASDEVIQPNSSIQTVLTVTNTSNVGVPGCTPVTCVVTFPDQSQQNFALGSGIVDSGSGNYTLTYVTGVPGPYIEQWSFTDPTGKVGSAQNRYSASY